ncbi:hypothetical protein TrCOL_g11322 [Triparma columacea]|uniref:FYVE-type domain-containing protein n=1 Tax=Triparma columacea TaxID=722753 RepID=A0A9W7GBY3_9STRA|nr:hypothetical protein TrCOL_g11322 [Triparma columacea]
MSLFIVQLLPKCVSSFTKDPVAALSCGYNFTCVVTRAGGVWSWGEGGSGQLGFGRITKQSVPKIVLPCCPTTSQPFVDISCGWGHTLALTSGGELYAWGLNTYGQLGLGDTKARQEPARVTEDAEEGGASALRFSKITASTNYSLAIDFQFPTIAALPTPWVSDNTQNYCYNCASAFTAPPAPHNDALSRVLGGGRRRHHCRACGFIFCSDCSSRRCLVHPDDIVIRGASVEGNIVGGGGMGKQEKLREGREPQRVCDKCFDKLKDKQQELRGRFANAMKHNSIDANSNWWNRTFGNSPLAFTLGHEVRKAAITLSNLLPSPKKLTSTLQHRAATLDPYDDEDDAWATSYGANESGVDKALKMARETCNNTSSNLREVDGVKIPARLLAQAKGIAVITVAKAGLWLGGEVGTGLVVARLEDGSWSAPSAVGLVGFSFGALIGAQISDHVFLLMSNKAVEMLGTNTGSVNLGADIGVAVGPVGRNVEFDVGVTAPSGVSEPAAAPIYTYSLTKGLYAGASFDGKVIATRHDVNEKFYGMQVEPKDLLTGRVPPPPAAGPLYESLKRASVYVGHEFGEEYGGRGEEVWGGDFKQGEGIGTEMGGREGLGVVGARPNFEAKAEGGGRNEKGGEFMIDEDGGRERGENLTEEGKVGHDEGTSTPTTYITTTKPRTPTTPGGTPWPF